MRHLRVFLDNSLEVAVALARALVLLLGAAAPVFGGAYVWSGDGRWLLSLAVLLPTWLALAWFGFYLYGNEEWKRGGTDRPPAGVRDN